jgi:hypothetical protein
MPTGVRSQRISGGEARDLAGQLPREIEDVLAQLPREYTALLEESE